MKGERMNILIIEDQELPLASLKHAVDVVFSDFFEEYNVVIAKYYKQAKEIIQTTESFEFVLLDHSLPLNKPKCTDLENFEKFWSEPKAPGYSLTKEIKNKDFRTVIIGTSSMKDEAMEHGKPDFSMSKMPGEAEKQLEKIVNDVIQQSRNKICLMTLMSV